MARRKPTKSSGPRSSEVVETEPPTASLNAPAFVLLVFWATATVSLANVASQLSLHPLYGGIVISRHFQTMSLAVCLFASLLPSALSTKWLWTLMSLIMPLSPLTIAYMGKWTASFNNPTWGPIIAQLPSSIPLQALATCILVSALNRSTTNVFHPLHLRPLAGLLSWFAMTRGDQVWWDVVRRTTILTACSSYVLLTLAASLPAAIIALGELGSAPRESLRPRYWVSNPSGRVGLHLAIPLFLSLYAQRTSMTCIPPPFPHLMEADQVRVLAKEVSVTGLIVVAEYLAAPFRYMRCDHSLLGGRWLYAADPSKPPVLDASIYSVFQLQEAIRLTRGPHADAPPRVLSIGLGIGVSVEAFIQHKMHTTVIEIDPAVYRFAREYFDLPKPDEAYFEDARQWVQTRISNDSLNVVEQQYDFVVHDCFSGGGVPDHIFTAEFWTELQRLVRPRGVVAVNFVGRISSPAARAVSTTLASKFGTCRAFHDIVFEAQGAPDVLKDDPFMNIVFFCSLDDGKLEFRRPIEADFLSSMSRRRMLSTLDQREIILDRFTGGEASDGKSENDWILTDAKNPLNDWQRAGAFEHFQIMQSVLPQAVWNAY